MCCQINHGSLSTQTIVRNDKKYESRLVGTGRKHAPGKKRNKGTISKAEGETKEKESQQYSSLLHRYELLNVSWIQIKIAAYMN